LGEIRKKAEIFAALRVSAQGYPVEIADSFWEIGDARLSGAGQAV
jgi:hypothetical protein